MDQTRNTRSDRTVSTDDPFDGYYLPGMFQLSTEPGRVERFLTTVFRRRGGLRPVLATDR